MKNKSTLGENCVNLIFMLIDTEVLRFEILGNMVRCFSNTKIKRTKM